MELPLELSKQKLATLLRQVREGRVLADEYSYRLDKILLEVYEDGKEMGLTESLNYVTNNEDRERLFNAIDEFSEERNNAS